MKLIFLGRKPEAVSALAYLLAKKVNVSVVAAEETTPSVSPLAVYAKKNLLPVISSAELYYLIAKKDTMIKKVDLVISYLYPEKIKMPLIRLPRLGCVNFHPAPLPKYKGRAGYNTAILNREKKYGVSAHFIDSEEFDCGPIIKVNKFHINPEKENALSLFRKTQSELLKLFIEVMNMLLCGVKINPKQNAKGIYLTKKQLEDLKVVDIKKESLAAINRKVRAFFFPPYSGATIKIKNQNFTIINNEVLAYLKTIIHE